VRVKIYYHFDLCQSYAFANLASSSQESV
jgi:hypothetical protein